ncbi:MAG: saccharopine dehydrogenase NADP-binding domain-containing protein [Raineya sp.]|jgi:short subunit dehydrogenase-like uncharacterized protein|nr:saccharopine dehydrogenase NADP-binding domain-containing protein [Raineya sp.]
MKKDFLIYGAYGYTGTLIAELAVKQGLKPILAGRDYERTKKLADKLGLEWLSFDISDTVALENALKNVKAILHCAGPFALTTSTVLGICLKTQTHYLDITGEIEVFEYVAHQDKKAKQAGITLLPGVGFDVVPSDCLAGFLKNLLPDATSLELAFMGSGGVSRGTALTMARNLHKGGAIRENGSIKSVPSAYEVKTIDYGVKKALSVCIPWGDVSTAYYSTQIPNIKVFMAQPKKLITWMKRSNYLSWLLGLGFVQKFIQNSINKKVVGPNETQRETSKSLLWGKVTNSDGKSVEARLLTPEGYKLTATTALMATQKLLSGNLPSGFLTPSMAFGADFILEVEGVERTLV